MKPNLALICQSKCSRGDGANACVGSFFACLVFSGTANCFSPSLFSCHSCWNVSIWSRANEVIFAACLTALACVLLVFLLPSSLSSISLHVSLTSWSLSCKTSHICSKFTDVLLPRLALPSLFSHTPIVLSILCDRFVVSSRNLLRISSCTGVAFREVLGVDWLEFVADLLLVVSLRFWVLPQCLSFYRPFYLSLAVLSPIREFGSSRVALGSFYFIYSSLFAGDLVLV